MDTSTIDGKDVRKAFRKQAQLWHPDKVGSSKNSTNISTQESNARFARLSQAYEVLSDPEKRKEYDLFLEYCQSLQHEGSDESTFSASASSLTKRFSSVWENIRDPLRVFETFFDFKDDSDDRKSQQRFDPHDPFSFAQYQEQNQQGYPKKHYTRPPLNERPTRTTAGKENLYDPMTGEGVLRYTQTEEYGASSDALGRIYYRVIAQDFKQRYDPYQTTMTYVPISDPYLQSEGYRYENQHPPMKTNNSPVLESLLHSWEVLTPESKLLVSPNRRFVAGLSPDDCELLIMVDHTKEGYDSYYGKHNSQYYFGEDDVHWSSSRSKTASPFGRDGNGNWGGGSCFAILKGPHLIVAKGDSQSYGGGNRILWYSPSTGEEDDQDGAPNNRHSYYEYEDEWGFWHRRPRSYLAQLDNDGSLSIYSVWSVPQDPDQNTILNTAWTTVIDWYYGRVPAQAEYSHLYYHPSETSSSSSSQIVYKRCIYSTSPVGCFRLGRKLTQLTLEFYFGIQRVVRKLNHFADSWLDVLYEEDDLLYSIKESLWRNGHALRTKMASSSARFVRKVMEYFVQQ